MAKPKLGRGLGSLIEDTAINEDDSVKLLRITQIEPNKNQPRHKFDDDKIEELSESIKEHGIIQPIIVVKSNNMYKIVAGERRWRAAMKAELSQIPCLVRDLDDEQNMLIAIIENMQREDLNPVEEAEGLRQMTDTFGMTQEQVSKSVGKSRPYITNSMRLLKLPDYIKDSLSKGEITAGHGRTLVTVSDEDERKKLWNKIVTEGLSVRESEKLVSKETKKTKGKSAARKKDPNVARVEEELKGILGTKVNINRSGNKGKIEIEFYSGDELERLLEILKTLG